MEPVSTDFFNFDSVVYDTLLGYLPDSSVSSLTRVGKSTYAGVKEHTRERWYWLKKLAQYGILSIPSHVDPFLLYSELSRRQRALIDGIVKYLDNTATNEIIDGLFTESAQSGLVYLTSLLLQDPMVDPSVNDNYAIRHASARGHTDVIRLLLKDGRVNPSAEDNHAIKYASLYGRTDVVRLLLQDPRVDPTAEDNYAIRLSSEAGYSEIVRLLLQDGRVDPSADDNFAIKQASRLGHTDVVELLLQDKRVDPSGALLKALQRDKFLIVRRLLEDPRVDPEPISTELILTILPCGSWGSAEELIKDGRMNPGVHNNALIINAPDEIVEMIVNDPRVDPDANGGELLLVASEVHGEELLDILLRSGRVDVHRNNNAALRLAREVGFTKGVKILENYNSVHTSPTGRA